MGALQTQAALLGPQACGSHAPQALLQRQCGVRQERQESARECGRVLEGPGRGRKVLQALGMLLHGMRPRDEGVQLAVHLAGRQFGAAPAQAGKVGMRSRHIRSPVLLRRLQRLVEVRQPPCGDAVFVVLLLYPSKQADSQQGCVS